MNVLYSFTFYLSEGFTLLPFYFFTFLPLNYFTNTTKYLLVLQNS